MSPPRRLAGVHLGFAVLLLPLIMLWYADGVAASVTDGAGGWAYLAVAIVYAAIAITAKPAAVYRGMNRLGVSKKAFRVLVVSATLFVSGVPVGELGSAGYAVAMVALVVALGLFLWAVYIALFGADPTPEVG